MVVGLLDSDLLAGEHLTHIDLAALTADATARRDHRRPIVLRILELLEGPGRRARTADSGWPAFACRAPDAGARD